MICHKTRTRVTMCNECFRNLGYNLPAKTENLCYAFLTYLIDCYGERNVSLGGSTCSQNIPSIEGKAKRAYADISFT